jgi:endonuclease/exonuclease/phosphatase family metal-dependent hydrolase
MSGEQSLKVMTLNVGRLFHSYPAACIEFVLRPEWDMICLQDLPRYVVDDPRFKARWPVRHYVPMANHFMRGNIRVHVGIGIFSMLPFLSASAHAYWGHLSPVLDLDGVQVDVEGNASPTDLARLRETESRLAIFVEIDARKVPFKIGTTLGPWTPSGQVDEHQRAAIQSLISIVQTQGSLVMAGDFNAARGGEIYGMLTRQDALVDCIPSEIIKTRDFGPAADKPNLVVDYFLKRGEIYQVSGVATYFGVSDHCALSATITRK